MTLKQSVLIFLMKIMHVCRDSAEIYEKNVIILCSHAYGQLVLYFLLMTNSRTIDLMIFLMTSLHSLTHNNVEIDILHAIFVTL